jgi:hypothetical protein
MTRTRLLPAFVGTAIADCSTPYKAPVFAANKGGDTSFTGIADMPDEHTPCQPLP